jgi:hypothetical protein
MYSQELPVMVNKSLIMRVAHKATVANRDLSMHSKSCNFKVFATSGPVEEVCEHTAHASELQLTSSKPNQTQHASWRVQVFHTT